MAAADAGAPHERCAHVAPLAARTSTGGGAHALQDLTEGALLVTGRRAGLLDIATHRHQGRQDRRSEPRPLHMAFR